MKTVLKSIVVTFAAFGMVSVAIAQHSLNGNYRLDSSRSENITDIVESATRNSGASAADRRDLEGKLAAPDIVEIDVNGETVLLSTSQSNSPVKFVADGKARSSQSNNGSTVSVRATLRPDSLTVSSLGGDTDYTLTFTSIDAGNGLRVTRRITTPYLNQTVFADSIYDRQYTAGVGPGNDDTSSNNDANSNDGTYSSSDSDNDPYSDGPPSVRTTKDEKFVVPNGMVIYGKLNNTIDTKASQVNDRFSITVDTPSEYAGAVIEGYLSEVRRSGRATGRATFTMKFEKIRMQDGKTYDFVGLLESATDSDGKRVTVGNENDTKSSNRTIESIKRGSVGAGLGALIGGILGGGKGALIGGILGGGAGAGSVIAQGRDDIRLESGSNVSVQSTSP